MVQRISRFTGTNVFRCVDRKKRLSELREAAKVKRYGTVTPISGSDFVREVTQASAEDWVVVCLYKDGYVLNYSCEFWFLLKNNSLLHA